MAIYPERKDGSLTGRYRIEVQLKGKRLRGRAGSLSEAKGVERELNSRLLAPEAPEGTTDHSPKAPSSLPTMQDGYTAANGLLWQGQETEYASFRKLERIKSIVGEGLSLNAFDANMVDKVVIALKAGGASDATVNRYLSALSAFLSFCFKRGLRATPAPSMDWRDEDAGRIRWITYEEEEMLSSTLPHLYAEVVHLAIRTGMRAAELLTLNPDQVEAGWVHLWKTKNGGTRSVPLTPDMSTRLKALIASGMPTYPQLRHQWDMARKTMGLMDDPTFVFHACRHTFATRAIQAGVNPVVLQKLMGHKTIQTTLRYAHVDDRTLSEASLSAILFHERRGGASGGLMAA